VLARLARVDFELSTGPQPSRQDKLALALARGLAARQQLAEAEGGSLSAREVASLLGISKTVVLKRLEARQLLAWREGSRQAARFPRWQFDRRSRVLAGLEAGSKRSIAVSAWMRGGKSLSSFKPSAA